MNCLEAGSRGVPVTGADVPTAAYPLGRWTLFKNPFVKRSSPPPAPVAPVQAEMMLDLVRPIRNDLSDSDLELVPARESGPVRKAASAPSPAPSPAPSAVSPVALDNRASSVPVPDSVPELAEASVANRLAVSDEPAAWGQVKEQLFGAGKS